jgi:hypothetical protein
MPQRQWLMATMLLGTAIGAAAPRQATAQQAVQKQEAPSKPAAWVVRSPYKNNPLEEAVLEGDAHRNGWTGKAELQLNCRPGNDEVYVEMHLDARGSGFDVDPFEGPGGAGEKSKGMTVEVGALKWTQGFSGFYQENEIFVFSSAMPQDEARAIVADAAGGQTLKLEIAPADGKGAELKASFPLPHEVKDARKAMEPCMPPPPKK